MQGSGEFCPARLCGKELPRMPLPELCVLLRNLKARRDAAVSGAVEAQVAAEVSRLRGKTLPTDQAQARAELEKVDADCAGLREWAARLIADEMMLEPDLAVASAWAATPEGMERILDWALKAAGLGWSDVERASVVEMRAAAVAVLHLMPLDPTPAADYSAASATSPSSGGSPGLTPVSIASAS